MADAGSDDCEINVISDNLESVDYAENDPRLNFYGDTFDPLLALRVTSLEVPDKTAKKYDNLALYNAAIEEQKNPHQKKGKKEAVSKIEIIRRWLPEQSRSLVYITSALIYSIVITIKSSRIIKSYLFIFRTIL